MSRCFFHFPKIFILWVVRGVKGQKTIVNDQKFGRLHSISQKPYITGLKFYIKTLYHKKKHAKRAKKPATVENCFSHCDFQFFAIALS